MLTLSSAYSTAVSAQRTSPGYLVEVFWPPKSVPITSASWSSNTVTATSVGHGLVAGSTVYITGTNPLGYSPCNYVYGLGVPISVPVLTTPTADTFTYTIGTNPGVYVSGGVISRIINSMTWAAGEIIVTSTAHGLNIGSSVIINGVGNSAPVNNALYYAGTYTVSSVTANTFNLPHAGTPLYIPYSGTAAFTVVVSPTLRMSSIGTLNWTPPGESAYTWTASPLIISGLLQDMSANTGGRLTIGVDPDVPNNVLLYALGQNYGFSDSVIRIWTFDQSLIGNTTYGVLESSNALQVFQGIGDNVNINPLDVQINLISSNIQTYYSPRTLINAATGFSWVQPKGTKVIWGNSTFILE